MSNHDWLTILIYIKPPTTKVFSAGGENWVLIGDYSDQL